MKKILIIHHCGSYGGAGVSLTHIVKNINREKYEITVFCPKNPSDMIVQLKKFNINIIETDKPPAMFSHFNGAMNRMGILLNIKNIIEIKRDKQKIEKLIQEIKPDIIAVNSMTLFWVGKVASKFNITKICFHREAYKKGLLGLRSKYIKYMLNKYFDKLIFISKYEQQETKVKSAYSECIYDKVEVEEFEKYTQSECRKMLGLSDKYKYILYVGGMSPLKGAHIIIKALKYIKYSKYKLVFLQYDLPLKGKKNEMNKTLKNRVKSILRLDYEKKVLNLIFKNRLEEKIIFRPNSKEVNKYYKACNVIVFPSTQPHQARPIYEAGISKIPIVITKFKNTEEFIKDDINGYEFRKGKYKELADILDSILHGKLNVDRVINKNYEKSILNHNIKDLYEEVNNMLEIETVID